MRALYDCGKYLTSFNFYEWLIQAAARGATKVVFDIRGIRGDKWPTEVSRQRFYSILQPGPALAGLGQETFDHSTQSPTNARDICKPGGGELVRFIRSGRPWRRLKSVKPAGTERYTVTLRKTQRSPARDSDEEVWREFAAEIGARVIPDYDVEPMHLHERMALYAGAQMNFFVSNGPGILCSLTEYPCMLFNTHHARESLLGDGMAEGEQYPWMGANQRAIWELATPEALRLHFSHWKETGGFL
jgi:hypothetical protein